MNMVIRTYMEKCLAPESNGKWGKVVEGEYELKDTLTFPNLGGHKSIRNFEDQFFSNGGNKIAENVYRRGLGNGFGIHSYQEISFE